jgi:hypothetical protein
LPPAKINPGRCPKKESGLQAFVRQYRDFMQIILLAAAAINLVVTGDVGTSVVLAGLTVFNAVSGAAAPGGALRAIDSSARPRSWRTFGRRHLRRHLSRPGCHPGGVA